MSLAFPRLRPAAPWAAEAFTVVRPNEVIGPSVAAFGVGVPAEILAPRNTSADKTTDDAAAKKRLDLFRAKAAG